MKALEFLGRLNPDQTLTIPAEIAALLPEQKNIRVLLLLPESSEEQDWERLAAEEFLQSYTDGDAIYDQLPSR